MSYDYDELEINPFYTALQTKFIEKYERAQEKCFSICVPQTESLNHLVLNADFVETHILRPSPYFQGQFMTTHSSNNKTLRMDEDGQSLTTLQGFSEEMTIRILSEELAYNKDYKQYKILILEKPLNSTFQVTSPLKEERKLKELQTPRVDIEECTEFLKSFPQCITALEKLDKEIEFFCGHYMVLPDYLDDAIARLEDISAASLKRFSTDLKTPLNTDAKLIEVLAGSIESYVMCRAYNKVFPVIKEHVHKEDKCLLSQCNKLNQVRPEQIGVRREFSCPLPSAVKELTNILRLHTPREKLLCLKDTIDKITEGITSSIKGSQQMYLSGLAMISSADDDPCITSDDLIPILVLVIAKAKCCQLHSDLYYMDNFIWDSMDKDRDDLSYCLVTFKAAVQYMMTTDFSHLENKTKINSYQISIEDLMASASVSGSPASSSKSGSSGRDSPGSRLSGDRLQRQRTRVTGILDQTTKEMGPQPKEEMVVQSIFPERILRQPSPHEFTESKKKEKENNQLGDFLSALQDDDFDVTFGKQN